MSSDINFSKYLTLFLKSDPLGGNLKDTQVIIDFNDVRTN